MGDVVYLPVLTSLDIPTSRVLTKADEKGLSTAVVVGWDETGEFYFASSTAALPEVSWLLKLAEKKLLELAE